MQCLKSLKVEVTSLVRPTGRAGQAFGFPQFYSNIRIYTWVCFLDGCSLISFSQLTPWDTPSTCKLHLACIAGVPKSSSLKQRQPHAAVPSPTAWDSSVCRLYPVRPRGAPWYTPLWITVTGQGAGCCVRVSSSWHCTVSMINYTICPK